MKLLLTSAGIINQAIANALIGLVGKCAEEVKIGFIPTAANVEEGNKDWFISQITNLYRFGFKWIDIVEIVDPIADWKDRLSRVDVTILSGGNTFYLLDTLRQKEFASWFSNNPKVYVGISAGSIVAGPSVDAATIPPADPNITGITDLTGMKLVDFEVEPHCDNARFKVVEEYASTRFNPVYALDDGSAIRVVDDIVDVVSEGEWKLFNPTKDKIKDQAD